MEKKYLGWQDIAEIFSCGRSKAMLLMHEIGVVYIGNSIFVLVSDLEDHIEEYGEISIKWPKRTAKRRRKKKG